MTALRGNPRLRRAHTNGPRALRSNTGWNPATLFAPADTGYFLDPATRPSLFQDTAAATPVATYADPVGRANDRSGKGNNALQATAGLRPMYARKPATGMVNLANGAGAVNIATFWPASATVNGITNTKVGSGIDTDGVPYVDVQYTGTGTGPANSGGAFATINTRIPAALNQTYNISAYAKQIAGSTAGVNGMFVQIVEETAPATTLGSSSSAPNLAPAEALLTHPRTLNSPGVNQVRAEIRLNAVAGTPIDITYRIKGLQFERAAVRTDARRRNRLTYTEDFSNALWLKNVGGGGGMVTNDSLIVDGISYAKQQATAGGSGLAQQVSVTPGQTFIAQVRLIGDVGSIVIQVASSPNPGATDFGLVAVPVTASGSVVTVSALIPAGVTTAWLRVTNTVALGSFYIARPQIEPGVVATAYQKVVSAADITEAGVADRYALLHDPVDDVMAVTLAAGTYTIAYAADSGVTILPGQVHGGGALAVAAPPRLYGALAINRALTAVETASLTTFLNSRRA